MPMYDTRPGSLDGPPASPTLSRSEKVAHAFGAIVAYILIAAIIAFIVVVGIAAVGTLINWLQWAIR